jgi:hypothetical protein
MGEFRGLLTAKEERWLAKFIDKLTPFRSKIIEGGDYFFYVTVIRLIDNMLIGRIIPGNWINPLRTLVELAKQKDTKAIGELMAATAAGAVDIPFLNEAGEKAVFLHAYGLLEAKLYDGLLKLENASKTIKKAK